MPSNALELALFLESDRMGYLLDTMTPKTVDLQRDVVKNERRQSYENRPYGMADIMLNELLDTLGYRGETMADKMKTVEKGDFKTISMAWEAHLMRNAIAHQGLMKELNEREARRIIGLYEQVFREFRFIE